MKKILLGFSVIAFLMSLAFVSAEFSAGYLISPTVLPGQDVIINFSIINTDASGYSSVSFVQSSLSQGFSWKELPAIFSINSNEKKDLRAVFYVPKTATGTITGVLKARNGSSTTNLLDHSFSIIINETGSFTATKVKDLSLLESAIINITNTGNSILDDLNISASGLIISNPSISLSQDSSRLVEASLTGTTIPFGKYTYNVEVKDLSGKAPTVSIPLSFERSFCSNGEKGENLSMQVDIGTSGDDEEEWLPLDDITLEVEVENTGDEDIDDIVVEMALYDSSGRNYVNKLDFTNSDEEKIELGDLNDGDEETVAFEFQVPGDLNDGSYKLTVKAYSKKSGETNVCTDRTDDFDNIIYNDIRINKEDEEEKFISFDDVQISQTTATCGEVITISADMFNIGDEDQDRVKVTLTNKELKLDESQEFKQGLNIGDNQKVSFDFTIPSGLTDKVYILELNAEYDYKNNVYRETSENVQKINLKIEGCTQPASTKVALISTSLESDPESGKELDIEATITNPTTQSQTYAIKIIDFSDWATVSGDSSQALTLRAGESKTLAFSLNVKEDATGEQSFTVEAGNGQSTVTEDITLTIESAKPGFNFGELFGNNTLIWVIGLVNLILIILIIIVAIKVSRR